MRPRNEMPTLKIRERMALKIAAKKTAEGYNVSDERCELCEMHLLSMNGNLMCKVCPALQKLVQMKNEADNKNEHDDARDTAETIEVGSASRDNEIVDKDTADTTIQIIDALADSTTCLTLKASNIEIAQPIENVQSRENAVGTCSQNMDEGVENSGKRESSLFDQEDKTQTHDEIEGIQDDAHLDVQESMISAEVNSATVESGETDLDSSTYPIGRCVEMPTFRIRQRIAMKVAARKTAQGYLVSHERCDLCEMPLLSMNGIVTCKICPAIEKWAQKKTEVTVSKNSLACDMVETKEASESHENELDDKGDALMNQNIAQDDMDQCKDISEADDVVNEDDEAAEASSSSIGGENVEMPSFRIRQRVAMKIAAKKTAQGFLISEKRCDMCEMPLLSMNGNLICKVCPAIGKWARKKSMEASQETGDTSMSVEITVEVTESCDNDLVESAYNDDTPRLFLTRINDEPESKDRVLMSGCETGEKHAKSKTAQLCEDALSPINSAEHANNHVRPGDIYNMENDTEQALRDALSPSSILTTRNDSFEDDGNVTGKESPGDNITVINAHPNVSIDVSSEIGLPDSAMPLFLNRLKVASLVDNESDLEEKDSKSRDDEEIDVDATATNDLNDKHEIAVTQPELAYTSTQDLSGTSASPTDSINSEKSPDAEMKSTETNAFQLHNKIICDDSTIQELQKAKFQLNGILAGCKFDLMEDTVEKLRSIFNCNLNEAEYFRNMFVDERNQSFEYEEQTMLLAMRGWVVTNAHCRRCAKSSMVLRPVDGEMMCPKCDDVEAGPAVIFHSPLTPVQHTYADPDISHESPRLKASSQIIGVPSHLNKWTPVDRACLRCSSQLMRNPNLETDHCPLCRPVSTTMNVSIKPTQPSYPTTLNPNPSPAPLKVDAMTPPAVLTVAAEPSSNITPKFSTFEPPSDQCELASTDDIAGGENTNENDILDAIMLKELRETMRQIEEAKKFLLSRRTPRMIMSPPPTSSNNSLYQISPALMKNSTPSSTVRPGILKPSGYRTPQLNNSGYQTPQIPGKYFFA